MSRVRIAVRLRHRIPRQARIDVDFRRLVAAGGGQRERGPRHYAFRVLLCVALPAERRCAGDRRNSAAAHAATRPKASIVDAVPPAAVAGGNVETSQRIVDVLLRALAKAVPERVPAASAGTMSNLTIGGVDPRTGEPFTYYETAAGGMGARPGLRWHLRRADAHDQLAQHARLRRSSMPIRFACGVMRIATARAAMASFAAAMG